MDIGNARIECTAKPITHAFIHFKNDGERNTFIRSANMLKKDLRGRKIKITRSMDAEERFHNKRMVYVNYYIHMKHNVPLESITTNWTMKYISINGQIVVKTEKWKPQIHQIQNRSRRTNAKMAVKKLIATTVSKREKGMKRREEGWTMSSQKTISLQGKQEEGRNNLMKVDDDSPTHMKKKRRRTTQASHH